MDRGAPVLLTGAAGFFGLAITRALTRVGVPVIATDRVAQDAFIFRPGTVGDLLRYVTRDLEQEGLDDIVGEVGGVVHAAALTPGEEPMDDMADRILSVNLEALFSLLGAVRRAQSCTRFILISSSAVYDQSVCGTLSEEDAHGGESLYGATKFAAEIVTRRWAAVCSREFCAVRPTSLIGPGEAQRPSRPRVSAFFRLLRAASEGRSVQLVRPTSRADWISVDDAAEAIALLWSARELRGQSFNVSTGRSRPLATVAEAVARIAGLHLDVNGEVVVDGGKDMPASVTNVRIGQAVRWSPRRSLDDVVRDFLEEEASGAAPPRQPRPQDLPPST